LLSRKDVVLCAEPPTSSTLWFNAVRDDRRPKTIELTPAWFGKLMRQHGFFTPATNEGNTTTNWVHDTEINEIEVCSPLVVLGAAESWVAQARRRLRTVDWLAADLVQCDALIVGRGDDGLAILAKASRLLSRHQPLVIFDDGDAREIGGQDIARALPVPYRFIEPPSASESPRFFIAAREALAVSIGKTPALKSFLDQPLGSRTLRSFSVVAGMCWNPAVQALRWEGQGSSFGVAVECWTERVTFLLELSQPPPNGLRVFVNDRAVGCEIEVEGSTRLRFSAELNPPDVLNTRILVCPIRVGSVDRFEPIDFLALEIRPG
jgi:hypothetical protein